MSRTSERETRNDKLSQVDWVLAICVTCTGVVDIETPWDCCWCSACVKVQDGFHWLVQALALIYFPVLCNKNQFFVYFYVVLVATHCLMWVATHSRGTVWVYRPESKPSHCTVCFHSTAKAFMAPTIGTHTHCYVVKLPHTFSSWWHSCSIFLHMTHWGY